MRTLLFSLIGCWLTTTLVVAAEPNVLKLSSRSLPKLATERTPITADETWPADKTALIICDVWDSHHSLNAVRRATEVVPRIEQTAKTLRDKGALIIHAPSDCMAGYASHAGRLRAKAAPQAVDLPVDIGKWCHKIPAEEAGIYPIDQADGGEDDDPKELVQWHKLLKEAGRDPKRPWQAQHAGITIDAERDAISDSGVEIWNLLAARGIDRVLLCGVHTNMCVLGRPFGLRRLAANGKQVRLIRDLTDTMYNPASKPFVAHHSGTSLIIEHIERYVCPTIDSTQLLGGEPFKFSDDNRKLVMMIGEDEYKTWETLPRFAETTLKPLGYDVTIIHAAKADPHDFPGLVEALSDADLLLVSVRRRTPPAKQLAAIRVHLAAGKPLIGIRTASHAFAVRDPKTFKPDADHALWQDFDPEVLGGDYVGHHGKTVVDVSVAPGRTDSPLLRGADFSGFRSSGTLYKVSPVATDAEVLLLGTIPNAPPEPLAWTRYYDDKRAPVFYTSLGHPDDFATQAFPKLLVDAIVWGTKRPPSGTMRELLPNSASTTR